MDGKRSTWTIEQSVDLYDISRWGRPYFDVNEAGNMTVRPNPAQPQRLDIYDVAQEAKSQGHHFPILIRFQDLLREKVEELNKSFFSAIKEQKYHGTYRGVFPIKVNQLREVVEEIVDAGQPYGFGLEVGSKPELFAALAVTESSESLLICNGYKDTDFIRTALLGTKLGKRVIMVIEKLDELQRILDVSESMGVIPLVGIRIRLQTKGKGKWALSGGEDAKFGLSTADLLEATRILRERGMSDSLQLLHFHVGSQVPEIQTIKTAVREATRYYAKLHKLGFHIQYLDVGGGLGIDYDGSGTSSDSSINYSLQEYCRDVIFNVSEICTEEKVPHPDIVSESGRALVTHHSVLLVEIFGMIEKAGSADPDSDKPQHKLVENLIDLRSGLNKRNRRESLHRALQIKDEASTRFELGLLELEEKALIETNFWKLAQKIVGLYSDARMVPEEVQELSDQLGDQFLCNFSVFQSLIDHWAVGQLFPIVPIHRLDEEPTRQGTLVDITCDSDGKIDRFIDIEDVRETLPLHRLNGKPYILGLFMMGAYQDVMGDLHNLFGPVTEFHVFLDEDEESGYYFEEILPGTTIGDVLDDVQYDRQQLVRLMKKQVDQSIKRDLLRPNEGMQLLKTYEEGLSKSTYLNLEPATQAARAEPTTENPPTAVAG
jgi:arginine decarboxylase